MRRACVGILTAALLLGGAAGMLAAFEEGNPSLHPTVAYTKVLVGSEPEYIYIRVDTSGQGVYESRRLVDESDPKPLILGENVTERLFALTEELDHFRGLRFKSKKRIANLGEKTLIYRDSEREHQVVYNYSTNPNLRELVSLFERIANVQRHLAVLQHAVKFDRLGLATHLRKIQIDLEREAIVDPQQLVSTLKQIASDPRLLNLAQSRAQSILEKLQHAE
ncbi:MAG: hypothetical protein V3R60_03865 [Acidobacteriota bacterium]